MIDAWIKFWSEVSDRAVDSMTDNVPALPSLANMAMPEAMTPDLTMPAAVGLMTPAVMGAAVVNTAAATWAGFWMGLPLAGAASIGVLTASPSAPAPEASARTASPKAAAKVSAKPPANVEAPKSAKPAAAQLDDRPAGLDAPKGGKADDLKRIAGVGPKLESVLNDLGIYHFAQIAAWTSKEIAWVDDYLRFKGRIERDGWIAQAKTFAKEEA